MLFVLGVTLVAAGLKWDDPYFVTAPIRLTEEAQQIVHNTGAFEKKRLATHGRMVWSVLMTLWVITEDIPGDIVETGTFKGHTTAMMMKALQLRDTRKRKLWAADSFRGLPEESGGWQQKWKGATGTTYGCSEAGACAGQFKVGRELFEGHMEKYGTLDKERLVILEGWFNETLAKAPIGDISFLRLDGDLYVSTWDALEALYHKVVPGGLVYVDDYGSFPGCRAAIEDFRKKHRIKAPLNVVEDYAWIVPKNRRRGKRGGYSTKYIKPEAVWWRVPPLPRVHK
eukprot:Hpha_TRINITY_DN3552_c0_g1::TRINITY_DN3552_c0_g1_i1::g.25723::m.25723/K05303/K05303; O-methyltransferase